MKIGFWCCLISMAVVARAGGADFNGDGADDIAVFRPSTGMWAVRGITRAYYGTWNDEPVPGNYDGAPGDEIAVYRATTGLWAVRGVTRAYYGSAGDIPVAAGGDADWYRSGANLCALAAGNIGIGTGNPQEKIHLVEASSIPDIRLERGNFGDYWNIGGGTGIFLNFSFSGTKVITVDGNNSRMGIGRDQPDYTLDAVGTQLRLSWTAQSTSETIAMRVDGAPGVAEVETDNADLFLKSNSGDTYIQPFGGKVRIGSTAAPNYALDVTGTINVSGEVCWNGMTYNNPDYVFEPDYPLLSLEELGDFIRANQRLPGMPSTAEVRRDGVKIFEQNRLVLEKLEEAYLYILRQEESISRLEERLAALERSGPSPAR